MLLDFDGRPGPRRLPEFDEFECDAECFDEALRTELSIALGTTGAVSAASVALTGATKR